MRSTPDDPVADLVSALDALAVEDLAGLPGPAVLERLGGLLPVLHRLSAEVARTVRAGELSGAAEHDGAKTMASWLRGHARLSLAAAGQLVRNGRTLGALPAVAAAAAAGSVTAEHVGVLAPVLTPDNLAAAEAQQVDLAGVDATFAELAATHRHAEFAQAVHHYLERLDPDGPEPDPTQTRSLVLAKHADGSLTGRFHLDAVGGEKVQAALESIVQANRPAGDDRTRAQQLADALVQLCDNLLASGTLPFLRRTRAQLLVTIGLPDLLDPTVGRGAARAGFGATLSAARARWAACDAELTRIVLDLDGLPLDVGRSQRLFPAHLRRALDHRDRGCVFTGCDAPTWWCDAHHLLEWALHGGATSLDNGALLCERHHTKVHHGYRIERQPDGRWRTWRPDGTEILLLNQPEPSPLIRAG